MFLFRSVMDHEIVDRDGDKAGKVDDILLQLSPDGPPAVSALLCGHGALARLLPSPVARLAVWLETRLLGIERLEPHVVAWEHVSSIDVVVHLDVQREEANLIETSQRIARRYIEPLPGSDP